MMCLINDVALSRSESSIRNFKAVLSEKSGLTKAQILPISLYIPPPNPPPRPPLHTHIKSTQKSPSEVN